jgi:hypothetical protein
MYEAGITLYDLKEMWNTAFQIIHQKIKNKSYIVPRKS